MNEIARRPDEVRGLSDLAFGELGDAVGGIRSIHRAIAKRAFDAVGPVGAPVRLARRRDCRSGCTRVCAPAAPRLGAAPAQLLARRPAGHGRELSTSRRGSAVLGAVNGLLGDELERRGSDLQEPMSVRVAGHPVAPAPGSLAEAFPEATPTLVVLVHGLMETEFAWELGADRHGGTYGSRLADELGWTPVRVRYNTGRHISENGRSLADLLEALVGAWPVEVERIALVGHSMGGLVSRSACHYASAEGCPLGGPRAPRRVARHPAHGRTARTGCPRPHGRLRVRRPRSARSAAFSAVAARASATCATALRSWTRTGCARSRRAQGRRFDRGAATRGR